MNHGGYEIVEILRDMHSDAFRNAAALPMKEEEQIEWQGLGFQVGGVRLVSPLGEVSELLNMPRNTHLPGVRSWLHGVANVRGRLIPIIDLHLYLGLSTSAPRKDWRVLIVEDDELVAGLVVEQSLGIQHFVEDSFEDISPSGMDALLPYLQGAYRQGGRLFYVASLKSLMRDERFFEVAERKGSR